MVARRPGLVSADYGVRRVWAYAIGVARSGIECAAVPEPATGLLLVFGSLALLRHRKRQTSGGPAVSSFIPPTPDAAPCARYSLLR